MPDISASALSLDFLHFAIAAVYFTLAYDFLH